MSLNIPQPITKQRNNQTPLTQIINKKHKITLLMVFYKVIRIPYPSELFSLYPSGKT